MIYFLCILVDLELRDGALLTYNSLVAICCVLEYIFEGFLGTIAVRYYRLNIFISINSDHKRVIIFIVILTILFTYDIMSSLLRLALLGLNLFVNRAYVNDFVVSIHFRG